MASMRSHDAAQFYPRKETWSALVVVIRQILLRSFSSLFSSLNLSSLLSLLSSILSNFLSSLVCRQWQYNPNPKQSMLGRTPTRIGRKRVLRNNSQLAPPAFVSGSAIHRHHLIHHPTGPFKIYTMQLRIARLCIASRSLLHSFYKRRLEPTPIVPSQPPTSSSIAIVPTSASPGSHQVKAT